MEVVARRPSIYVRTHSCRLGGLPSPAGRGIVAVMTPDTAAAAYTVEPMAPRHQTAWLQFFDRVAFADNPRWASCYCQFPTADHPAKPWKERDAAENRASACQRIAAGQQRGVVALDSAGAVVGWCNAGPWRSFSVMDDETPEPLADQLGAITCFVVAPAWRGRGVSQALLRAACEMLKADGLAAIDAWTKPGETSPAANHTGSFTLYQRAGFVVVKENVNDGVIVRKAL